MVFSNESALPIRCAKYWSFSFSISPSNEYSGLISFSIGWIDLLAVQGTLKSLLQHHNLKALVLRCSACFIVQFSLPYVTALPELKWSIRQFKMPRSSMNRLPRAVFWTSRASEVGVFCSLVNASPLIWIHDSFFSRSMDYCMYSGEE